MGRRQMVAVGGSAETGDEQIGFPAAPGGAVRPFQHDDAGPLAQIQAATRPIEGFAGLRAGQPERMEAHGGNRTQFVGPAGQYGVAQARLQPCHGHAHGIRAGRAGVHHGHDRPRRPRFPRDALGQAARREPLDGFQRGITRSAILGIERDVVQLARHGRAQAHPEAETIRQGIESGIRQRLAGRLHGQMEGAIDVGPAGHREHRQFHGQLGERANDPVRPLAVAQGPERSGHVAARRGQHAQT